MRLTVNKDYKIRVPAESRDAVPGEVIDLPEKEALLLIALGRGTAYAEPPPVVMTRVIAPDPEPADDKAEMARLLGEQAPLTTESARPVVQPYRNRYNRRDLRAAEGRRSSTE